MNIQDDDVLPTEKNDELLPTEKKDELLSTEDKLNDELAYLHKIYGIISIQHALTAFVTGLVFAFGSFQDWMIANWPLMVCCGVIIAIDLLYLLLFLLLCGDSQRKYTTFMILLVIFTIFQSLLIGGIAAVTDPLTVLIGVLMTLTVTVAITAYACLTKLDPAIKGRLIICGISSAVVIFFIFFGAFYQTRRLEVVFCLVFEIIYAIFIGLDGVTLFGRRWFKLSDDDYAAGVLFLLIDFLTIVGYVLFLVAYALSKLGR